ncbi:hypothetical protein QWZ02_11320 [Kinneretia asaccharophila]|uniref:Uncharacterized protein n=1 Tax=Roseateles asaccharophilus TaxID=582607 RepID=A0A4R6NA15_9BURK|nr:hypothetical protein [Roseateles asaccharophilus]MDN3545035.1 hypothetical protein [Roseateles asaccharophilus]TDP12579.1 hypothetical protein DFR39_10151 [Roseateles asaccharophilus]
MKLSRPQSFPQWLALVLALACALPGLALALHYPLSPVGMGLLCLLLAGLAFVAWRELPLLVPALLPVIGWAPWTGWISFEELDLLVLSVCSGAYAALALGGSRLRAPAWQRPLAWSALSRLLLGLFALSLLVAAWRGVQDAGGWRWGWWQSYQEPMNSLRALKAFVLVLLLLPLWRAAADAQPRRLRLLGLAMSLALLGVALSALWERYAFPGLLNFSSDYRTVALFWEAHMGGAPLDGVVALSLPFALVWLLRERRPLRFGLLLGLMLLGAYTVLASFSRGLYLAAPLGLGMGAWLLSRQFKDAAKGAAIPADGGGISSTRRPMRWLLLALLGFAIAAVLLFPVGGYRTLLALSGSAFLLLLLPPLWQRQTRAQRLLALMLALMPVLLLGMLAWMLIQHVSKLAYVLHGLVVIGGAALALRWRHGAQRNAQACLLAAAFLASLACVVLVAGQWGGAQVLDRALPPALLLALGWVLLQLGPGALADQLPSLSWRSKGLAATLCLLVAVTVGVGFGGAYAGDRFSTAQRDLQARLQHWSLGLSLLQTPGDWLLGRGAGRFAADFFYAMPAAERVGHYQALESQNGDPAFLRLSAGQHVLGWGELFRISQRIDAPPAGAPLRMALRLRTERDVNLHLEICDKLLLYNAECVTRNMPIKALSGQWQSLGVELGNAPSLGRELRPVVFSVAVDTRGARVDLAQLSLRAGEGPELLRNGDFGAGMARWFSSSDHHHMPWHMKSLPLHVLFEQGLLGLGLWSAMLLAVLWRCTLGSARQHELAPAVVGGLLAFVVVGLFDSLIDAPRLSFMFYAVLALGLGLRAPPPPPRAGS